MSCPLVDIVIINYNGMPLLRQFLPSVAKLNYPNYEVIVVDNASTDDSVKFLKEYYHQFKIIQADNNYGTAEGSNIGAKYAKGEYIFFISNDMELDKDILNYMIERMENEPDIGICTCKMKRITETGEKLNIIDSAGADIDIFGFPCSRGINQVDNGKFDYFAEVFFSFGGAMLIRNDVFKKIGGYDSHTFTLGDDIDLSWRVHLLGYRVVVEPKAHLYHRVSSTLGTIYGRTHKRFLSEKNTLRALLKNYSLFTLSFILPFYLMLLLGEMIFFLLVGRIPLASSGIKAVIQTFKEFPDILKKRKMIQSQRKISDFKVFKLLKKKSHKLEIFFDFIKNRGKGVNWDNYFG